MEVFGIIVLIIYALAVSFIFFFSLAQLFLVLNYIRAKKQRNGVSKGQLVDYPFVTIQLPLYNEKYVVRRLLDKIVEIDYPKDKLEIQILDDSTDETTEIIQNKLQELSHKGVDFNLVRRPIREGFKAGALKYGLEIAKGEFIAIFDADFLPEPDFLLKTLPSFGEDEKIGVVQTRWGHLNRGFSLLTKLQAFGLDAHFTVEQVGRNVKNHFINFNGTGGVWRKSCILDAGNWEQDTLTEDLDLSYRAQLKDWKFVYLEDVVAPAELPITMSALRSQQFRWMKGGAECAVKNLGRVFGSTVSFKTKYFATMHLLNSTVLLAVFVSAIFSVPLMMTQQFLTVDFYYYIFKAMSVLLLSLLVLGVNYYISFFLEKKKTMKSFFEFVFTFLSFLSFSMGLSLHNSIAVVEGLVGKKSPFIRTPKFNISESVIKGSLWRKNVYSIKKIDKLVYAELFLGVYFLSALLIGLFIKEYAFIHYHMLLAIGFFSISVYSIKHSSE